MKRLKNTGATQSADAACDFSVKRVRCENEMKTKKEIIPTIMRSKQISVPIKCIEFENLHI